MIVNRRRRTIAIGLLVAWSLAWGCSGPRRGVPLATGGSGGRPSSLPSRPGVLLLRVGLAGALPAAVVEATGSCRVLAADRRPLATVPAGKITCRTAPGGVRWQAGERTGRASDIVLLVPLDPDRPLRWQGRSYAGEIWVRRGTGGLTVIDVVPLEQYLRGVVPWEIGRPGRAGLAALQAQAVAARTYSVAHLGEHEELGFDLWADVRDQVYRGLEGTDPWTDRAVRETRGLVLRHEGREIEAYYCAACGGWCSEISAVWPRPQRPYLVSHPDRDENGRDWCATSPHHDWTVTWSATGLEKTLARTLPDYLAWLAASPARRRWAGEPFHPAYPGADPARPGDLLDLAAVDTTPSGRLGLLEIRTTAGIYHIRGDRIRWVLPPPDGSTTILPSIRCRLTVERDATGRPVSVTATGHGNGHGIGLCQSGALAMARAGRSYREILAHYYPGTVLEHCDVRNR